MGYNVLIEKILFEYHDTSLCYTTIGFMKFFTRLDIDMLTPPAAFFLA
jgi:hypothetical protein